MSLLTDKRIDEFLLLFRMMDQWPTQRAIQCFARAIEAEVRTLAAGEQLEPVGVIGTAQKTNAVLWSKGYGQQDTEVHYLDVTKATAPVMFKELPLGTLLYAAPLREQGEETAVLPANGEWEQGWKAGHTIGFAQGQRALARVGPNEGSAHPVDAASTTLPKDSSGHSVGE